jgi:hypothetical protein
MLASWPVSNGLKPFQQLSASEMALRWGFNGYPSVEPPHLAALLSDVGRKSPSWLGFVAQEKRCNIEVFISLNLGHTSNSLQYF